MQHGQQNIKKKLFPSYKNTPIFLIMRTNILTVSTMGENTYGKTTTSQPANKRKEQEERRVD